MHITGALRSRHEEPGGWSEMKAPALGTRVYRGERVAGGTNRVWIETKRDPELPPEHSELDLHLELRNHSPTGFAWGYGGSGPAQLALALLMHALGDQAMALAHYQDFKQDHVAGWKESWSITAEDIQFYVLSKVTRERPAAPLRFPFGSVVATPGALLEIPKQELQFALGRHLGGDWGELCEFDWRANETALREGGRLFSAYVSSKDKRFWIITEASRAVTTLLLPEEY